LLLFALAPTFSSSPARSHGAGENPQVYLWAWQRAEDLRNLNPSEFGVAYMACRVVLQGDTIVAEWRQQPLKVHPKTRLIPVVRLETSRTIPPAYSTAQIEKLANLLLKVGTNPRASELQIDFDALQSERQFYRSLLEVTRARLPRGIPLSITALASWCLFDNWINDLPVDETVPMMFSLGRERAKVLLYFRSSVDFMVQSCCSSLGISLEDSVVNALMIPRVRQRKIPVRIYVFTKTPWTEKKVQSLQAMLKGK
jgi:hypothetical protein